jgi:putative nucleotidyltransferase with HDIG domain
MEAASSIEKIQRVGKYITTLLVVAFISTLFPNNARFKYQFEQGGTWKYDDLTAPFDFPIKKLEEELEADKASRESNVTPVYELATDVARKQKDLFEKAFKAQWEIEKERNQFKEAIEQPNRYLKYSWQLLDRIYNKGVILLEPMHMNKKKDFVVNVLRGDELKPQTLGNLLTIVEAKTLLSDSLPYSPLKEPEFLLPLLEKSITYNLKYNAERTAQFEQIIPETKGIVKKGDLLVTASGIITDEIYEKLMSFKTAYEQEITKQRSPLGIFLGYFLLTSLVIGVFMLYIQRFAKDQFQHFNQFLFMLMWLVVYSYLVYLVENINIQLVYLLPFCIVPIVVKHFYNSSLALFAHVVVILIASFLSSLSFEFTFVQIIAGITAILGGVNVRNFTRFIYLIAFIFSAYFFTFLGLSLIQEGSIQQFDWTVISLLLVNMLLILLAHPLIPLLGRIFGFTSSSTLLEWEDMNQPLLKQLATTAPGTFQHSLQVANLAEAAGRAIQSDYTLLKVAALYHDIGKIVNANYFIENQNGINPHNNLQALESAKIIIAHVEEGLKLAKKYRLPKAITRFIATHHGTTLTEYFLKKHMEAYPKEIVDKTLFQYNGLLPVSREETILMLADSIEAASRSLRNATAEEMDFFVEKIVNGKINTGQLKESQLSFSELEICCQVFKNTLRSIYHPRVDYPK